MTPRHAPRGGRSRTLAATTLLCALAACSTATDTTAPPTPHPTPDPTLEATSDATTEPTPEATPQPTPEAIPEPPEATPGTTPPAPGTVVEDGSYPAYLTTLEPGRLGFDRIEILSGEEAEAARAEDGMPPGEPGVDLPYLRNRDQLERTAPVAQDAVVQVYDCSAACTLAPWTYADLVAGVPLPYGNVTTPFTLTVRGGQVTELVEVYLP